MKKLLPLLVLGLVIPLSALADTSVWKATKGDATVYLGGTCHLLRPADLPLPAEYDQAYAASQKVFFETDIARVLSPDMQQTIMTRGLYESGQTLQFGVDPEAWGKIEAYCAKAGLPLANVTRMKPWLFVVVVTGLELQKMGVTQEGADVIFFKRAKADNKPAGHLETFDAHLDFITGLGAGRESEMVRSGLDDLAQSIADFPKLLAAWRAGDLAAVEKEMLEEMRAKYPDIYKQLIVTRNNAWLGTIDDMLKSPEVEFVLAGFGHFAGPDGLIEQLRKRGCEVTQLKPAK